MPRDWVGLLEWNLVFGKKSECFRSLCSVDEAKQAPVRFCIDGFLPFGFFFRHGASPSYGQLGVWSQRRDHKVCLDLNSRFEVTGLLLASDTNPSCNNIRCL